MLFRHVVNNQHLPTIFKSISEKCRVGPSSKLCVRVHKRLEALSQVLNERADFLVDFRAVMLAFLTALRWQHQRPFLYWFASHHQLVLEVSKAHMGIDEIYGRMGLQDENPVTQAEWAEQRTLQERKFTETLDKTPITILIIQVNDPAKLEEIRLKLGQLVGSSNPTPVTEGPSTDVLLDSRCSVVMLKLTKRILQQLPQPSNYSDLNQDDWNQIFIWHIPREDVTFLDGDGMPERGTYGVLRRAEWTDSRTGVTRRDLVAKTLIFNTDDTAINFSHELRVWGRLRHDNVLNMLGANHVSREKFFLSERATANFANFFSNPPRHVSRAMLWDLFHQAAEGLRYLHSLSIEHGGLKCSNILVFEEGATEQDRHYTAKLSDFGFSVIRNQSAVVSQQAANHAIHWRAPERLQQQPDTVGIDFKSSDVYSLGLCIVEVVTGQTPFGDLSDSDLIDAKFNAETYPRSGQLFTDDDEWALVARMTSREPANRPSLAEIISEMKRLAARASS